MLCGKKKRKKRQEITHTRARLVIQMSSFFYYYCCYYYWVAVVVGGPSHLATRGSTNCAQGMDIATKKANGGRAVTSVLPLLFCFPPFGRIGSYTALATLPPAPLSLLASQARSDDEWRTMWGGTGVP